MECKYISSCSRANRTSSLCLENLGAVLKGDKQEEEVCYAAMVKWERASDQVKKMLGNPQMFYELELRNRADDKAGTSS